MSRRVQERRTGARRAPRRTRWRLVIPAVAAIGVMAWFVFGPRHQPRGAGEVVGTDPAAGMTPDAAYAVAVRLSKAGRHGESLPFYRQALSDPAEHGWVWHYNYGGALYNVGLEVRDRQGVPVPVVRSSIERVALMREALAQLEIAERLAMRPRDRATVLRGRGERLQVWGFPWEGFVLLRQAQWADPDRKELGRIADGYGLMLEHPDGRGAANADARAPR